MIIGTATKFIKLGTNETVMSISKVHLTTIIGEGDYPAGWYRICTLQIGIETVPSRLVHMYPPGWKRNCTQQVGMETVPSRLVQYTLQVGAECVPSVSRSREMFTYS
jgi:hypothetical protein